ncbi:MAG: hypothetical protein WBD28_10725 [Candidatus Zixiibacteriota bacterium]
MKGKLFFWVLLFMLSGISFSQGYAQNEGTALVQSSFLEVILNLAILLAVCGCFVYAKKIESFLKGGELSLGWLLIFISFLLLVLLQFVRLGNSMNIFSFDSALYSFFKLVWVILLGWGIYRLKKVLS